MLNSEVKKIILYLMFIIISSTTFSFSTNVQLLYLSDSTTVSEVPSSYSKVLFDGGLYLNLNNRGTYLVGWSYSMSILTDTVDSSTAKLSITEMGPTFGLYIGREKQWSMFAVYNLKSDATYAVTDATTLNWTGSSFKVSAGYMPLITKQARAGIKLVYYSASFDKSFEGTTNYAEITNKRGIIYPAIALSYNFDGR